VEKEQMNPIHFGITISGIFIPDNGFKVLETLKSLEGQRTEVIYRKQRSVRSNKQNSYYHSVVIKILADYCGYETSEMHEALKEKFLSNQRDDNGLIKIKSTTKLSTGEFEEFLDKIKRFAATELHCVIPNPNEVEE
jgi:hypothetical protein